MVVEGVYDSIGINVSGKRHLGELGGGIARGILVLYRWLEVGRGARGEEGGNGVFGIKFKFVINQYVTLSNVRIGEQERVIELAPWHCLYGGSDGGSDGGHRPS